MKYFDVAGINRAISIIREGPITQEHITSRATLAMTRHYFKQENGWYIVPEQIQAGGKRRPDYVVEKFIDSDPDSDPYFLPHLFIEVKSLVNGNIGNILDQLAETITITLDDLGGSLSCFVVAMKGTKIAFYTYHTFGSLLYENYIPDYKGYLPLNYDLDIHLWAKINSEGTPQMYQDYINSHGSFSTDADDLRAKGALSTKGIDHPHILDLVNQSHKNDIHNM